MVREIVGLSANFGLVNPAKTSLSVVRVCSDSFWVNFVEM
jgi:hypothetical protein